MSATSDALDALGRTFEEFKSTNEQRLKEIEDNGASRADTDEKMAKMNDAMDDLRGIVSDIEARTNRPGIDHDKPKSEYYNAFMNWIVTGDGEGDVKKLDAQASVNIGTAGDGGYALPEELEQQLLDRVKEISPVRSVATVRQTRSNDYKEIVNTRGTTSGWVAEAAARPETTAPSVEEVAPTMGDLYAAPKATQWALDDLIMNVDQWLVSEIATEFAYAEGKAFIDGTGTNQPTGFTAGTPSTDNDGSRTFGVVEYVPTGVSGDFAASDPHEIMIDLVYLMKARHRANGRWMMAKATIGEVRKMKDGDGNLIWQPGLILGQPDTLLGYPVVEAEDMPAIAADSFSIAFGDFAAGYLIADRMGVRLLRDPYTDKPHTVFYATQRVGGKVRDDEAIKLIKFGTS